MDEQRQDDQLEPIHNSSVSIQDVALKTNRERRKIERGGGRRSGRSVLAARHDDDDDDEQSNLIEMNCKVIETPQIQTPRNKH